jgi:serine/threonine protein kinase
MLITAPVNLNHFRLLRVVGKGAFGKVRIVERKDTGLTFALKYIRKDEGQRYPLLQNTVRTSMLMPCNSRAIRERPQYHPRTAHARASQPPLPVQSAVQLPGHRIPVRGPDQTHRAAY